MTKCRFLSHVRLQILIIQKYVKLKCDCPVYMCKSLICKDDEVPVSVLFLLQFLRLLSFGFHMKR